MQSSQESTLLTGNWLHYQTRLRGRAKDYTCIVNYHTILKARSQFWYITMTLILGSALHKWKQTSTADGARWSLRLLHAAPAEKMGRVGLHTCILLLFNGHNLMHMIKFSPTAPNSVMTNRRPGSPGDLNCPRSRLVFNIHAVRELRHGVTTKRMCRCADSGSGLKN